MLGQRMMGLLYDVETHTINYHLKKVFGNSELGGDSVIRNFRITAADGKSHNTQPSPQGCDHINLWRDRLHKTLHPVAGRVRQTFGNDQPHPFQQ